MTIAGRVQAFAAKVAPDHTDRPRTEVPSWLLMPGLILLGLSLIAYGQFIRAYPQLGIDITMYRGALHAFVDGHAVYQHGYGPGNLPYTYPPVTLPVLLPLIASHALKPALYGMILAGIIAMLLTLWFTTKILGYRGAAGRLGIVALTGSIMLWTEPYWWNFDLGQVNALVMLPIVIDLSLSSRSRYKGIGIGIATASKLLPGLFIVYLLLTRRIRAAVVAIITFVGLTAIGWIIRPRDSFDYWVRGLAFDSHRVLMTLGPRYVGNQSLQGFVARMLGTDQQNSIPWILAVLISLVAGLTLAVMAQRRGEEAMAMVIVAFTALLISPVSWSHYWLWCAPMALVLVDVARRTTGTARHLAIVVAFAGIAPFLMYPLRNGGPLAPRGLLWVGNRYPGVVETLFEDPYVLTSLSLFVIAALWLRRRPALFTPYEEAGATPVAVPEPREAPEAEQIEPVAADR